MRYTTLVITAFIAVVCSSCEKTYTCVCNSSGTGNTQPPATQQSDIKATKKEDAKLSCDKGDFYFKDAFNNNSFKTECELE